MLRCRRPYTDVFVPVALHLPSRYGLILQRYGSLSRDHRLPRPPTTWLNEALGRRRFRITLGGDLRRISMGETEMQGPANEVHPDVGLGRPLAAPECNIEHAQMPEKPPSGSRCQVPGASARTRAALGGPASTGGGIKWLQAHHAGFLVRRNQARGPEETQERSCDNGARRS